MLQFLPSDKVLPFNFPFCINDIKPRRFGVESLKGGEATSCSHMHGTSAADWWDARTTLQLTLLSLWDSLGYIRLTIMIFWLSRWRADERWVRPLAPTTRERTKRTITGYPNFNKSNKYWTIEHKCKYVHALLTLSLMPPGAHSAFTRAPSWKS